jgi:hypothetical protein
MTRRKIRKSDVGGPSYEEKIQRAITAYNETLAAGAIPSLRQLGKKYDCL